jgi:hypothetical protein
MTNQDRPPTEAELAPHGEALAKLAAGRAPTAAEIIAYAHSRAITVLVHQEGGSREVAAAVLAARVRAATETGAQAHGAIEVFLTILESDPTPASEDPQLHAAVAWLRDARATWKALGRW